MPSDVPRVIDCQLIELETPVASRYGVPVISHVDPTIFTKRYYTHCLQCGFCRDLCCSYGVDVDLLHRDAIERRAEALEAYTGISPDEWFADEVVADAEMPGGGFVRTRVKNGRCVFHNASGRGCLLHFFCTDLGIDYHELKSVPDCLFPLTVTDGTLAPADEVDDLTLVCVGQGSTLYRGLRSELQYYFGGALVAELDRLGSRLE